MRSLLLVAGLVTVVGCSPEPAPKPAAAREAVSPAGGTVRIGGQPAAGASVLLLRLPLDPERRGDPVPTGQSGADGTFTLSTFSPGDGSPAGQYAVLVTWNVPRPGEKAKGPYDGGQDDRLAGKYADPKTTPLRVEVTAAGPNRFDLTLDEPPAPAAKPADPAGTPATPR